MLICGSSLTNQLVLCIFPGCLQAIHKQSPDIASSQDMYWPEREAASDNWLNSMQLAWTQVQAGCVLRSANYHSLMQIHEEHVRHEHHLRCEKRLDHNSI